MGDDARDPSLAVLAEQLREIVREEVRAAEQARQSRIADLLETSGDPRIPPPGVRKARRPNPYGLHIVRALVPVGACALAAARRPVVRRVAAGALIATVGTAGALSPDVITHAPAAQLPVPAFHHVARGHRASVPVLPAVVLPRRTRRRAGSREAPSHPPSQRPSPSPSPTVSAPVPQPTPLPTIPLPSPPVPSPVPTCVRLTGQHCHHDGLLGALGGDAVSVPGALRGLIAQP